MPLGTELRGARERAGLSIEQISHRTRIEPYEIIALENDSLTHVPDESYLQRLILSYAAEVNLNAAPVMERLRIEREQYERDWNDRRAPFDISEDRPPQPAPEVPETYVQAPETSVDAPRPDTGHTAPAPPRPRRQRWLLPLMSALAVSGWTAYVVE